MNFVIVKPVDGEEMCLRKLPSGKKLHVGDTVVVEKVYDRSRIGVCCCDSFETDNPDSVYDLFNVPAEYVVPVIGYLTLVPWEEDESEEQRDAYR